MQVKDIVSLLDNSQDAETIALEIVSHETLHKAIKYFAHGVVGTEAASIVIRELWDIAYSYGYQDGKAEAEEGVV